MFLRTLPILLLASPFTTHAATLLKVSFSSQLVPTIMDAFHLKSTLQALTGRNSYTTTSIHSERAGPQASLRNAVLKVVASVQAGHNQKFDNVLIDTGSGVLWVGGKEPYRQGPHTQTMNSTFSIGYSVGEVSGTAFRDTVTIGEASASAQIIGSANSTSGFSLVKPIDGILGLGPSGGNAGQVSGLNVTPTFVETLVAQGSISSPMFGIHISPLGENGAPEGTGEITFGGIDESRIRGDVTWIAQNPPLNFHWEFNVTGFTFGQISLAEPAPARTDTGDLGILIPFDQIFAIRDAYNGTLSFSGNVLVGFLAFPPNVTHTLPALNFTLGTATFSIPPARYLVPRSLYPNLNITDDLAYTWIGSAGPGGYGFGQKWLENVYTAYDMENHRIGFAQLA